MARYGIVSPKIFGVSMATMKPLVRTIGRDHELAAALWESGWLEARIGKRNGALNLAATGAADRLVAHERAPARWIGRDVLRELRSDTVQTRLARRAATAR